VQGRHHFQTIAIFEAQIDHGIGRRLFRNGCKAFGDRACDAHIKATAHHGALETL
jgi:hypothetical protein